MDLQAIKKQLEEAQFSKETTDAVNNILGMAMARDNKLTDEEINEIIDLVDDDLATNHKETTELLTLIEAVEDVQEAMLEARDEAHKLGLDEEQKNNQSTAPSTPPTPPTTPPAV